MAALDKLRVVHHPERAKVIFVPHKALVQRQVRAYRILRTKTNQHQEREQYSVKYTILYSHM